MSNLKSDGYITYSAISLSCLNRLIPSYCSKFIPYDLAGKPNGPIDHELQRFDIN